MPSTIVKIKLINYRRFQNYTIEPNPRINILVGDNEVGKSSVLEAIDLVASGNTRKVESLGVDALLNIDSVLEFDAGVRIFERLPKLIVELFLNGDFDHSMNGKNNTDGKICDGIRLICEPNPDYQTEIADSMRAYDDYFPYDYYSIRFSTFADEGYTGYKRKLRSVFIDNTNMNSEYATSDFIKRMYSHYTEDDIKERAYHKSRYRQAKNRFRAESLKDLNDRILSEKNYEFGLKSNANIGFENELMIYEDAISIDSKGTGTQVFIKTDFTLERSGTNVDVVLFEEPENHLSSVNLRKLVGIVAETQGGQIFIATHNNLISTRLELRNLLMMHDTVSSTPTSFRDLSETTVRYFMKAPVASILEFVISKKTILVEGPSEYMLLEKFFISTAGEKPERDGTQIIDVRGLSFKRYLEVAQLLGNRVAVVTDNDGDKQKNCIDKYAAFENNQNIEVFYDQDDSEPRSTFEKILYLENKNLCNQLFGNEALRYMLTNKTESAYVLLEQDETITVPDYIRRAIEWIRK